MTTMTITEISAKLDGINEALVDLSTDMQDKDVFLASACVAVAQACTSTSPGEVVELEDLVEDLMDTLAFWREGR